MKNLKNNGLPFDIMNIELTNKFIENVNYERVKRTDKSKEKKSREVKISLKNETYVNAKNSKSIKVRIFIAIEIEQTVKLDITYDFEYKLEEDFTEEMGRLAEFKSTTMSMAYPYIKAFAEQLVSMSGVSGVMLPFLDFNTLPNKET